MRSELTANSLSGRAIGSLIFTGFGCAWMILGLYVREQLSVGVYIGMAAFVVTVVLAAIVLFRRAGRYPREAEDPRVSRAFRGINTIQWIAIFLVATVFHRFHHDEYGVPAIAFVVGLHLFPLAHMFRNSLHYFTGTALVLWAAWTAVTIRPDLLQGVCALGTGIILWASAYLTMMRALIFIRQDGDVQPTAG